MLMFVAIFLGDTGTELLIWPSVFPRNLSQSRRNIHDDDDCFYYFQK